MRTKDEMYLVRLANDIANRMELSSGVAIHLTSSDFYHRLKDNLWYSSVLCRILFKMNDEKLGLIIGTRLSCVVDYKEKTQFLQTVPMNVIVDTEIVRYSDGHGQLIKLAMPVVVAAMYDLLITEGLIWKKIHLENYTPKPAMRNFVLKHRFH